MLQAIQKVQASHQMTVTPQLQQAIGLLQLSSLELEVELRRALEENVFLELEEAEEGHAGSDSQVSRLDSGQAAPGISPESEPAAAEPGLAEHLAWQVGLSPLSQRDRRIAEVLIDSIDEDGYLLEQPADLLETLRDDAVTPAELEAVRAYIRQLDPVGCAARSLAECLQSQLDFLKLPKPLNSVAQRLAELELRTLAAPDVQSLALMLDCQPGLVENALQILRKLDPAPGRRHCVLNAQYIVPDVLVRRSHNRWVVGLNPANLPRLRLNQVYAGMLSPGAPGCGHYAMQQQLREARWLVKSVAMRNETLLKVAGAIMRHQRDFLDQGEFAMRPMILRQIAEEAGVHESTVSRVTTQKYVQTPRGLFELKYFFSSRLATRNGGRCSSTAVRALVRQIIEQEQPHRPLSDGRIAALLSEKGIRIARRTVAKYREAMGLPPVAERLMPQPLRCTS